MKMKKPENEEKLNMGKRSWKGRYSYARTI